jgi:hypothetical protein
LIDKHGDTRYWLRVEEIEMHTYFKIFVFCGIAFSASAQATVVPNACVKAATAAVRSYMKSHGEKGSFAGYVVQKASEDSYQLTIYMQDPESDSPSAYPAFTHIQSDGDCTADALTD